ncbi:two-component system, NtrC family, sensor kinase [Phycisphaerales bacterium]|nr:two-component system, NtrC family, sensor kinase [Phycisphaerales bacterium]
MNSRDKVNILLVDDQPAKLLSLEAILSDLGENLIKANSAEEGLKHLLSNDIAVVLVDVCMPRTDGFEFSEMVRGHPRFGRTAIIFISAVHLTDADRLRGYQLGAVDYIPVPIIPEVLRAKVAVFTELYRKTEQLERVNAELKERIAELDRSNERLRFADRMATVGTLAAGLGHDMGNLLLPVQMRLDALETCDLPKSAVEDVTAIRKAAEYLRRLASSLRLLALDPENLAGGDSATELSDWWRETEGMIRNGLPRTVVLSADIPEELSRVRMDKASLTQVVFNLVQNAGEVLRNREDGQVRVAASMAPGRRAVLLTVRDNGPGMSEEAKRRCFEPFYTTKTRELNTGLGLTLVAGLIKRAGGTIQIESVPGTGTVFRLEVPEAVPPARESGEGLRRRVAVVQLKDERLMAHVRSVLSSLEFDIRDNGPAEADVLILDGQDLTAVAGARGFVAGRPESRVLVFGGDASVAIGQERILHVETAKPSELLSSIRGLLTPTGAFAGGAT